MVEGDGLQDLEDRGQRSGSNTQAGEVRLVGGAPLMYHDVEVYCEGGVLDSWLYEEGGFSISHSNHSREDTLLGNIACYGAGFSK